MNPKPLDQNDQKQPNGTPSSSGEANTQTEAERNIKHNVSGEDSGSVVPKSPPPINISTADDVDIDEDNEDDMPTEPPPVPKK